MSKSPAARRVTAPPGFDALLEPYRVPGWRAKSRDLAAALAEAEAEYKRTRDPVVALAGAEMALEAGAAVPQTIAAWLAYGLSRPPAKAGGPPQRIDEALGLAKPGRASPFRREKEDHALRAALGRMFSLQLLGATIPQAAALVARLSPEFAPATLESHYRRGGYSANARQTLALNPTVGDPEPVLAEYPDTPLEVAQAKVAIRAMYAKRRL